MRMGRLEKSEGSVGKRLWRDIFLVSVLVALNVVAWVAPAAAKVAEPPIATKAWYWEDSQSREETLPDGSKVTIETPNPFCPAIPGSLGAPEQSCAEGRLPVEIRQGDYETPNKLSAVNFDFSLLPLGSKVSKFTATFYEAKAGCYDSESDKDENPNYCEQTDPVNIEGKELQACKIDSLFGEGEARPYKEVTKYTCTPTDPTAKRKEKKLKGDATQFAWTFDLTKFAQEWTKEFTTNSSVMLVGKPPKGYKPGDSNEEDTWRTVLVGPKAPTGLEGIVTKIVFKPGSLDLTEPPPGFTDPGTTGGTTGSTGGVSVSSSTGSTGDFGSTSSGSSAGGGASTPSDAASPAAPVATAAAEQVPQGFPAYAWLAIIAGLVAWAMFRSIVLENAKGIRPDGVLAQIQLLNAAKRGGETIAAAVPSAFGSFLGSVKHGAGSLLGKMKLTRKG